MLTNDEWQEIYEAIEAHCESHMAQAYIHVLAKLRAPQEAKVWEPMGQQGDEVIDGKGDELTAVDNVLQMEGNVVWEGSDEPIVFEIELPDDIRLCRLVSGAQEG